MDENTRKAVRESRRHLRREICKYQRAITFTLGISIVWNAAVYGVALYKNRRNAETLSKMQERIVAAESVRDDAVRRYGALVLEVERRAQAQEEAPQEAAYTYLGECTITYYCCEPYPHVCGNGDGLTATGVQAAPGIVAVDKEIIPLGSTVLVDGLEYTAADTGGAIKGMRIDVCVEDHRTALELGTHTADVWVRRW